MGSGLPMLNCLLQHALRSLCSSDSSNSSKWVYAVFWRILPRNFPPPKWEFGGTALDRSKGNKRNWILVWEDGFCDFQECEQAENECLIRRFGTDMFFKMSHEVYNYGEGLVGKVAADNSHKWVFGDIPNESDATFIPSWNVSIEIQPRAWDSQFHSGIQTIAVISVREGIVQLGSFEKIMEDLNLVISVQRIFSYLHSLPGVFAIQRPYLPIQHPYILKPVMENHEKVQPVYDMHQVTEMKRKLEGKRPFDEHSSIKSLNLGWNSPQGEGQGGRGRSLWSLPSLLARYPSHGALLTKMPPVIPSFNLAEATNEALLANNINSTTQMVKIEESASLDTNIGLQEGKWWN